MTPNSDELRRILDLYEKGLCLQAYAICRGFSPIAEWTGVEARIMGGRLAWNLGAPRTSRRLFSVAYRENPEHPEARYFYVRAYLERHGPLATWALLGRMGDIPDASPELRSEWLSFRALVAAVLRDFDVAEEWLGRAEALAPENEWVWVERAALLEMADRYPEALEAAQRSLEIRPWYRPGVESAAHALQLLGRDEEALDLLVEADRRIESAPVVGQLLGLQTELGRYQDAAHSLDRMLELTPLREPESATWLAGVRSTVAYHLGDFAESIAHAREADSPFFAAVADRMESAPPDARRVLLPVGFVRQHHVTCVPATLAAISRFWSMPADHLSVAEEICYDGTPDYGERRWAEENGWVAREFTITWESAVALLDRGIPVTLTTVQPTRAHEQAVIGYDSRRGTLLVRDPFFRHIGEGVAERLFRNQRSSGPRGLVMVPADRAADLEGVDLLESGLYDRHYAIMRALVDHRREDAGRELDALCAAAPGHRITLRAKRAVAAYDGDEATSLACIEQLLAQYPDDGPLELMRLSHLRDVGRRADRLAVLARLCKRPDDEKEDPDAAPPDPIFWQQYAVELSTDARERHRALRLIWRSLKMCPVHEGTFHTLAGILWDDGRREDALTLFRFAACLEDKNENLSQAYFAACRCLGRADTALTYLRSRFERFGAKSSQPARTLFGALAQVDRDSEGFEVLDQALELRANDGDLLLFAADSHAHYGRFDRADELLASVRDRSSRGAWLRTAATIAQFRGDPAEALRIWREVVASEPLAVDAHRSLAQLLAEAEGTAAANRYFQEVCDRFPHHYALHQLWAEWLRDEDDPAAQNTVLCRMLDIHPAEAWACRELTLCLVKQRRFAEAEEYARTGLRVEPENSFGYCALGDCVAAAGRLGDARDAYRAAIRLFADNTYAIGQLVSASDSIEETREALRFVRDELVNQSIMGDGLLAFAQHAQGCLEPDELLETLREAVEARPDLWHGWVALTRQLAASERMDSALETARSAADRFALLPAIWCNLAYVYGLRDDRDEERAALRAALAINPAFGFASRELCKSLSRYGDFDQAREVMEAAIMRAPLEAVNHFHLSNVLWRMDRHEQAIERLKMGIRLAPGEDWAWDALRDWSREVGRADEGAEFARDLTVRRAGDARAWLALAGMLTGPASVAERLAVLEKAIQLNPRCFEAYDLRAETLTAQGRFDEAVVACSPSGVASVPTPLKGRRAWIEAERGDLRAAVRLMRDALAQDPGYCWGWQHAAIWSCQLGDMAAYEDAARQLTIQAPYAGAGFALLGDARLRRGDRAGAKAALARAVALSPDLSVPAKSLFDAQMEDREFDAAASTLDAAGPHMEPGWEHAYRVALAVRRKDAGGASDGLRALCLTREAEPDAMESADAEMVRGKLTDAAESVYAAAMECPDASPHVAALWVRSRTRRKDWKCEERIAALPQGSESRVRAAGAYVEALGDSHRGQQLKRFVERERDALRAADHTWARVGIAMMALGWYAECREWTRDWRSRLEAEPWMLLPAAATLRYVNQDAEASEVSLAAIRRPTDRTTPLHTLWLAYDAICRQDCAAAMHYAQDSDVEYGGKYYGFIGHVVEAVLAVQRAGRARKGAGFSTARRELRRAVRLRRYFRNDPVLKRVYFRGVEQIAADVGGPAALLWRLLLHASF